MSGTTCETCGGMWLNPWHTCTSSSTTPPTPSTGPLDDATVRPGRNWRWVAMEGFTELCGGCDASDATHYHRPQESAGVDSDGFTPETASDSHSLSPGAAGEAGPLDSGKRCVVCGSQAGVHLTTAQVCPDHATPVALERAVDAWREEITRLQGVCAERYDTMLEYAKDSTGHEIAAMQAEHKLGLLVPALHRWMASKDAWDALTTENTSIERIKCVDEMRDAERALLEVAREVCRG